MPARNKVSERSVELTHSYWSMWNAKSENAGYLKRETVRNLATEMSRRRSFVSTLAAMQRASARAARAHYRQQTQAIREAEVDARNRDLAESVNRIESILAEALGRNHRLDFEKLKSPWKAAPAPRPEDYLPKPLGFFARFLPGAKERHHIALRESRAPFDADVMKHAESVRTAKDIISRQHHEIDELKIDYEAGKPDAIPQYFELVLSSEHYT